MLDIGNSRELIEYWLDTWLILLPIVYWKDIHKSTNFEDNVPISKILMNVLFLLDSCSSSQVCIPLRSCQDAAELILEAQTTDDDSRQWWCVKDIIM